MKQKIKSLGRDILELEVAEVASIIFGIFGISLFAWIGWDMISDHGVVGTVVIITLCVLFCTVPFGAIVIGVALAVGLGMILGPIGWVVALVIVVVASRR